MKSVVEITNGAKPGQIWANLSAFSNNHLRNLTSFDNFFNNIFKKIKIFDKYKKHHKRNLLSYKVRGKK